jgi:drug/metabolite transporter (DMT)-like permease
MEPGRPRGEEAADRRRGVALGLLGILVVSPDALLIRSVDADLLPLIFWRSSLTMIGVLLLLAATSSGHVIGAIRAGGRPALTGGTFFALATTFFVVSITRAQVASALAMLSAGPLFASVLSSSFAGERIALRTWVTSAVVVLGVGAILATSGSGSALQGNVAALVAVMASAAFLTTIRRFRAVDMTPAVAVGGAISAVVAGTIAWIRGDVLGVAGEDLVALLPMGLVVLPVSLTLLTRASRSLPAPELGLLSLLETVLGPLWVWLAGDEVPGANVLTAGGLIVIAVATHTILASRAARPASSPVGAEGPIGR